MSGGLIPVAKQNQGLSEKLNTVCSCYRKSYLSNTQVQ